MARKRRVVSSFIFAVLALFRSANGVISAAMHLRTVAASVVDGQSKSFFQVDTEQIIVDAQTKFPQRFPLMLGDKIS